MAQETKTYLKSRFENGDIPNQDDFGDLIDSQQQTLVAGEGIELLPDATTGTTEISILDSGITADMIPDNLIVERMISSGAINTDQINDGAIVLSKLDNSVYSTIMRKDDYAPNARVGLADDLYVEGDTVEDTNAHFAEIRSTAGTTSVSTGIGQFNNVKGALVKQLVKNGNFADWTENVPTGWSLVHGATIEQKAWGIRLNCPPRSTRTSYLSCTSSVPSVVGHKVIALILFRSNPDDLYYSYGGNSATKASNGLWTLLASPISTITDSSFIQRLGLSNAGGGLAGYLDIAFYEQFDLTELGLDSIITTSQRAIDYFGGKYIPDGIEACAPTALSATGSYNQFNKSVDVLAGKGINAVTGAIEDVSGHSVIWAKCIRGISGTGENNGYRIVDNLTASNVVRAGFSYFAPDDASFEAVQSIAEFSANYIDFLPEQVGYIVVEVADIANIQIGLKWSYSDTALAGLADTYQLYTRPLPALSEPLRGLLASSGTVYADEVDLKNKKLIRRITSLPYSLENIATVEALGVPYLYDSTIIYYVLATPVEIVFTVDGNTYLENDMGTERWTVGANNVYPLVASFEYFASLKDSLRNLLVEYPIVEEVIAVSECDIASRVSILEQNLLKLVKGDVICDKITTRELNLQGTTSLVRKGAGAPTTAPDYIGQFYVDTTNGDYYKSTGNESVSNWVIL